MDQFKMMICRDLGRAAVPKADTGPGAEAYFVITGTEILQVRPKLGCRCEPS